MLRRRFIGFWGVVVGVGVLAFAVTPLLAGTYHNTPLVCSDCHVMHASYAGTLYNAGAGYDNLLKFGNTNWLCLDCHASNGPNVTANTPQVAGTTGGDVTGTVGSTAGDTLAGGWFGPDQVYTDAAAGNDNTNANGHDLEVTAVTNDHPPGDDATDGWRRSTARNLNCASCHDQHGNSNYRNLRSDPNDSNAEIVDCTPVATVAGSTSYRGDSDVWQNTYGTGHYDEDFATFCQDCHEKFGPDDGYAGATGQGGVNNPQDYDAEGLVLNASGGVNTHHPIDMDLGATIGTNYTNATGGDTVPLLRTSGAAAPSGNSVFCLSCHRAHGSGRDSSLRWAQNPITGGDTVAGGTAGCQVCHNK